MGVGRWASGVVTRVTDTVVGRRVPRVGALAVLAAVGVASLGASGVQGNAAQASASPAGGAPRPFEDEYHKAGPPSLPGVVYAALYDLGGEGVAYHDTTPQNEGSDGLNRDPKHQRAHASEYTWHFRARESADISFVKDWADLNHPNAVTPPINGFYLGWTDNGEWTRYTVDVREPGHYTIRAMYSFQANAVSFDLDGVPAADCKVPVATGSYHHWNLADIGVMNVPKAGRHVLTFHYVKGNNWMSFEFRKTKG